MARGALLADIEFINSLNSFNVRKVLALAPLFEYNCKNFLNFKKGYQMKAFIASALFIALVSLAGCDNKEGIEPNVENQETKQIAQEVETGVVGEFKLVKVEGSASVFVLKDGKISPITNWNWVERNAPNKTIETVTKSEMDSFAVSDIIYK